jgi:hypothetical protein
VGIGVTSLILLVAAMAGCADAPAKAVAPSETLDPAASTGRVVRGSVVDDEQRPIAGVNITHLGGPSHATTNETGSFVIDGLPRAKEILLQARHALYRAQTLSVNLEFVQETSVRFVLGGGPGPAGYHLTNVTKGQITCQVAAGSHHGSPGFYKYSCRDVTGDAVDLSDERVRVPVDPGVTVVIVELEWTPQSQAADVMGLTVYASTSEEELLIGSLHSFPGGHYIGMKASTAALQSAKSRGGFIESFVHVDPGTLDEHVPNAGVIVEQPFTLYTTAFYNEIPPPVWTALDEA